MVFDGWCVSLLLPQQVLDLVPADVPLIIEFKHRSQVGGRYHDREECGVVAASAAAPARARRRGGGAGASGGAGGGVVGVLPD